MNKSIGAVAVPLLALALFSGASAADDDYSSKNFLLGDWGGLRSQLHKSGVDFAFEYGGQFAYNPAGGTSHRGAYADQAVVGATLDLDRLFGWHDAVFKVTLTDRNGTNLSSKANLGTLNQVQEVYGRGSTVRWTQLYYEQKFFQKVFDLKLGRLNVGDDFFPFPCTFENLSFCGSLPGNIVSTWYNWPVSQWGARAKFQLADTVSFSLGLYQINPNYLKNEQGLRLDNPGGTIGGLVPVELDWKPKLGPDNLPGIYAIGGWRDNSNGSDVLLDVNGSPRAQTGADPLVRGSESGVFVMARQQLTRHKNDASRGLTVFGNWVQADAHTATVDQLLTVGLIYSGPFDYRPHDDIAFAAGKTHANSRIADGQRIANASIPIGSGISPIPVQSGSEYPFEVYYSFHVTPAIVLRPNVQYIHTPGGTNANPDIWVLGLKYSVTF